MNEGVECEGHQGCPPIWGKEVGLLYPLVTGVGDGAATVSQVRHLFITKGNSVERRWAGSPKQPVLTAAAGWVHPQKRSCGLAQPRCLH